MSTHLAPLPTEAAHPRPFVEPTTYLGREVAPVAAAVLPDTNQPKVARIRAFGLVARRLSASPRASLPASTDEQRPEPTVVSA